jgi:hypothetical protein
MPAIPLLSLAVVKSTCKAKKNQEPTISVQLQAHAGKNYNE